MLTTQISTMCFQADSCHPQDFVKADMILAFCIILHPSADHALFKNQLCKDSLQNTARLCKTLVTLETHMCVSTITDCSDS